MLRLPVRTASNDSGSACPGRPFMRPMLKISPQDSLNSRRPRFPFCSPPPLMGAGKSVSVSYALYSAISRRTLSSPRPFCFLQTASFFKRAVPFFWGTCLYFTISPGCLSSGSCRFPASRAEHILILSHLAALLQHLKSSPLTNVSRWIKKYIKINPDAKRYAPLTISAGA